METLKVVLLFPICVDHHRSHQDVVQFIGQAEAQAVDDKLMGAECKFSVDQLMELAGLSVACVVEHCYKADAHRAVLIVSGPGSMMVALLSLCARLVWCCLVTVLTMPWALDNGGDSLVCARHLAHFGYNVTVFFPKRPNSELHAVWDGRRFGYGP